VTFFTQRSHYFLTRPHHRNKKKFGNLFPQQSTQHILKSVYENLPVYLVSTEVPHGPGRASRVTIHTSSYGDVFHIRQWTLRGAHNFVPYNTGYLIIVAKLMHSNGFEEGHSDIVMDKLDITVFRHRTSYPINHRFANPQVFPSFNFLLLDGDGRLGRVGSGGYKEMSSILADKYRPRI
jgi:hypothetical protein